MNDLPVKTKVAVVGIIIGLGFLIAGVYITIFQNITIINNNLKIIDRADRNYETLLQEAVNERRADRISSNQSLLLLVPQLFDDNEDLEELKNITDAIANNLGLEKGVDYNATDRIVVRFNETHQIINESIIVPLPNVIKELFD